MPRAEGKNTEANPSNGDRSGNVSHNTQEKPNEKKKQKRFNPYSNRNRNPRPYYGRNRE